MFSNNYKAVFELLGNNEKYNSFEKKYNQKIKANMLANQPANFEYLTEFKDEDESGLEERLRRINSVCSFTIQTAKAQTTMRDSVTAKTITVKHLVYRAMDRTTSTVRLQSRTKHLACAEDCMEGLRQAKRLLLSKGSDESIQERATRWFGQRLCIRQISSIAISCKA